MKHLRKSAALAFMLSAAPAMALAYNIYDYDPYYTPYNLAAAIDHGPCQDEIEEFDSIYWKFAGEYQNALTAGGGLGSGANAEATNALTWLKDNDFKYEAEFKQCLSKVDREKLQAEQRAMEEAEEAARAAAEAEALRMQQKEEAEAEVLRLAAEAEAERIAEEAARRQADIDAAVAAERARAAAEKAAYEKLLREREAAAKKLQLELEKATLPPAATTSNEVTTTSKQLPSVAAEPVPPTVTTETVQLEQQSIFVRVWRFFTSWF